MPSNEFMVNPKSTTQMASATNSAAIGQSFPEIVVATVFMVILPFHVIFTTPYQGNQNLIHTASNATGGEAG